MEGWMTQVEILERYMKERGLTRYALLDEINERLGEWRYSRMSPYNWFRGKRVDPRRMREVIKAYPPDDWRSQMARELLEVG
jgi:hypothetical protein